MRAFIGIPLEDDLRPVLAGVQEDLKLARAPVSWVRPDLLHLTLRFLGDIPDAATPRLDAGPTFDLELHGVGDFQGRVVWAGVRGSEERLAALARRAEEAARGLGLDPEAGPYRAHVTLGRLKLRKPHGALRRRMEGWKDRALGTWRVRRAVLFRSERGRDGSVYSVVKEYPCDAS